MAGVIKMVRPCGTSSCRPTLHADEPSPHVDWSAGEVELLTEAEPWPRERADPARGRVVVRHQRHERARDPRGGAGGRGRRRAGAGAAGGAVVVSARPRRRCAARRRGCGAWLAGTPRCRSGTSPSSWPRRARSSSTRRRPLVGALTGVVHGDGAVTGQDRRSCSLARARSGPGWAPRSTRRSPCSRRRSTRCCRTCPPV